ncbi:MAG: gamma-butyrobetaine hydroxylase-like domain-containing protein [Opitutales bacterium]
MKTPANIQIIGQEVAIAWDDGSESYYACDRLRAASPSAETQGERDIFGQQYGGGSGRDFRGVTVVGWDRVGNYAICFHFSDGHRSGLYSYDYLAKLAAQP